VPRLPALALALPALALSILVAGCGGGSGGGSAKTLKPGEAVGMKSLRFHPDHVKVTVGQPVTWRNDEGIPHDVVATSGATFESRTFGKDGTFSYTPGKAGTIKYECTLHPGMEGELDVVEK
jgi:plastocyanin